MIPEQMIPEQMPKMQAAQQRSALRTDDELLRAFCNCAAEEREAPRAQMWPGAARAVQYGARYGARYGTRSEEWCPHLVLDLWTGSDAYERAEEDKELENQLM